MRSIKERPTQSTLAILGVRGYKVGSLGLYKKENDIWFIWARNFDKFDVNVPNDEAPYAWRPVEDNLLAGWEYLGKGSMGLAGSLETVNDAADDLLKRNQSTRGHAVLQDGIFVHGILGNGSTKRWAQATRRTDYKDGKVVRIRVIQ